MAEAWTWTNDFEPLKYESWVRKKDMEYCIAKEE